MKEAKRVRRGLFISTILMVVLLVVALSTATFAWFSASNVVNIAQISFTAGVADDDGSGGELVISFDENAVEGREITFVGGDGMNPMIPLVMPERGQTYEEFVTGNFFTATEKLGKYATSARGVAPYVCKSESGEEKFYLINTNPDYDMSVTAAYVIEGENAAALCVAVFADDGLCGIMSNGEKLYYGEIVAGAETSEQSYTDPINEITITVPAGGKAEMRLVSWYSGNDLTNAGAQKTAVLTALRFTGNYVG